MSARYEPQLNLDEFILLQITNAKFNRNAVNIFGPVIFTEVKHADAHAGPFTACRPRNKECVCLCTTVAEME
jgi:hypothetical protein